MDIITYVMSALLIMTLVYEHGFLISFQEIGVINILYHIVWVCFSGRYHFTFVVEFPY